MATNGQSGAWVQAPPSLGAPSRLPRVPLLLSTWFWDLTFSLPFLFSSKSHHKGAVCQLCTGHLSLPPCPPQPPFAPFQLSGPRSRPSLSVSLSAWLLSVAPEGPGLRHGWAAASCGFCGSSKTSLTLCVVQRPAAGGRQRKENLF